MNLEKELLLGPMGSIAVIAYHSIVCIIVQCNML